MESKTTTGSLALLKQFAGSYGGLEKQTLALAKGFSKLNQRVELLCQGPCQWTSADKNLHIHPLSKKRSLSYFSLASYDQACQNWLKNHPYDRILGLERHSLQTHYRAGSGVHRYFLEQRLKAQHWTKALFLKLNPFHQLVLKLEARTFAPLADFGARRIYTNSYRVAEQIQNTYQVDPSRLCTIHNGVTWQALEPLFEQRTALRSPFLERQNLNQAQRYLLFIGNGYERKGLSMALHALAKAHSSFHLLVCGKERHIKQYQRLAYSLGIDQRVHWLGRLESINELYASSEALLLPTLYDPFANVTLEALAMGLFAITSTEDGASEVIESDCGLILDPLSLDPWIAAIEERWRSPPNKEQQQAIRSSVQLLEFETQLNKLMLDLLIS